MRRIALAVVFTSLFATQAARANDGIAADKTSKDAAVAETTPAAAEPAQSLSLPAFRQPTRPLALPALYAGFAGLQAYDVYSTTRALRAGAVEANPHLRALVNNPAAFIGLKAVMTAGPIFAAERLWRDHHRVGAIALMAAANGMMAAVAAHNAQVIAHQR